MKRPAKSDTKRVGLWIRVSTDQQAKTDSPEHHEARGRAYADFRQWKVVEVYHLEGTSGKSVIEHPEALRMFEDIKRGHITGLIFSKLARLGRNTRELLTISDIFQEHEADLISLEESIDTSSPSGRFFFTLLSAMAEWERSEIGSRVAASIPIRAKLGKQTGGIAPFGYEWNSNRLEINEKEAPVRKLVHELFVKHKRKKTVARLLNEQGYRMRKGTKFTDTTVDRLLRDPVVKGLRRANYTTQVGTNGWKHKPEEEWVFVDAPPIISIELWDQCQKVLEEISGSRKRVGRLGVHLFSTVTYCTCGTKMYMRTISPKYVCTNCKNKIDPKDLEAVFHSRLKNFQFSDTEIQNHLNKQLSILTEKKQLLATQREECQKLKAKADGAFELFHSGQLKKESFGDYHAPLYEAWKQKEETILALEKEIDTLGVQVLDDDQVLQDTRNLYSMWDSFTKEDKKTIINTIVSSIVVAKDEVTINLSHLPSIINESLANGKSKSNGAPTFTESLKLSNATMGIRCLVVKCALTCKRPKSSSYPKALKTLGDHLRAARLDRGLTQPEVARQLRVGLATVLTWELNKKQPRQTQASKIINFIGYIPYYLSGMIFREQLRLARTVAGFSIKEFSKSFDCDASNLSKIELGKHLPKLRLKRKLEAFIKDQFCRLSHSKKL